MNDTQWKNKYISLKARYIEDVDVAFRLGFEQGAQSAQMDAQQQMMQSQQEQQAQAAGQPPQAQIPQGQDDQQAQPEEQQAQPEQAPEGGSELDQHIGKLESMISKGDMNPQDLLKALESLKDLRKSESNASKRLKQPIKLNAHAHHNLPLHAKQAVTTQHKIVADIMKSWAEEEKRASQDVRSILAKEGLFKSEE